MPLAFDERQLLMPGVHEVTLEEVAQHFGRFQRTDRRMTLVRRLKEYVEALRQARIPGSLVIDGSFIMPIVEQPEDIDLILILDEGWDFDADLKPYQYNLVSKRRVKQEYRFDLFTVAKGSADEQEWLTFFAKVNRKWCEAFGWSFDLKKGLVRVSL